MLFYILFNLALKNAQIKVYTFTFIKNIIKINFNFFVFQKIKVSKF